MGMGTGTGTDGYEIESEKKRIPINDELFASLLKTSFSFAFACIDVECIDSSRKN